MNDFDIYNDNLKDILVSNGYLITEEKEINYGIMYRAKGPSGESVIRVYRNKKGKITLDTSQTKDENLKDILTVNEYEEKKESILIPPPLIGTDEAGKGDYYSSLIVAGIYADEKRYRDLEKLGVKDSKSLTDRTMAEMSIEIIKICPDYAIVEFTPEKLTELHEKYNTNELLGMAHGKIIAAVHKKTGCSCSLSDKFGPEKHIENAISHYGVNIKAHQYPRAEVNAAVAAASIIARTKFIKCVNALSEKYDMPVPLGAGENVDIFGVEFVKRYGIDELKKISKYFFKNTQKILSKL